MNTELDAIFSNPEHPAWVLQAKGEPRWMACPGKGRVGRVTQFAPPNNLLPRLAMKLFSFADVLTVRAGQCLAQTVLTSKTLWFECADQLKVPVERVGFCIGTANADRKIIALDITGHVPFVIKIAVGAAADQAIFRETAGLTLAAADPWWRERSPRLHGEAVIAGRPALMIERVEGRPLSPFEFKQMLAWRQRESSGRKTPIGEWIAQCGGLETAEELQALEICKNNGALDMPCSLGVIHGDFSTWNVVRTRRGLVAVDWEFAHADTPVLFDPAYACWSRSVLLKRSLSGISKEAAPKLIALGALWDLLRRKRD